MSRVDLERGEVHFKLVYYGPGLSGRTSNFQYLHARTDPAFRTPLASLATATERELSFGLRPRSLRQVHGLSVVLDLHTTPGAVYYDPTRLRILQGVDGVVFVADSQVERHEANLEMMAELHENLRSHGRDPVAVPLVLQYNKRDLPNAEPLADLQRALNPGGHRHAFEAVAHRGEGVFDTLKAVTGQALLRFEATYRAP